MSIRSKIAHAWSTGVLRDFFVYSLGTFLEKGIAFLLVPFYTRVMSPAEYGTMDTLLLSVWFTSTLVSFGLPQLIYYHYFQEPPESRFSVIQNLMGIYVRISSPIYLFSWPILILLLRATGFGKVTHTQTFLVVAIAYLSFFDGLLLAYWRLERKTVSYVTISILKSIIVIGATALFVKGMKMGITGGVLAVVCGSLFGTSVWMGVFAKTATMPRLPFRKEVVFNYLKTGLPLVPSALMAWALLSVDRYLLNHYQGTDAVGIYSTANKFASIFEFLVLTSLANAYSPKAMGLYRDQGIDFVEKYNRKNLIIIVPLVLLAATIFLGILFPLFPIVVGPKFQKSFGIVPILLLGKVFYFSHLFFVVLIMYQKKVRVVLVTYALTLVVSVSLNSVLIPKLSVSGAAVSFCFTNLFFTFCIFSANRYFLSRAAHSPIGKSASD